MSRHSRQDYIRTAQSQMNRKADKAALPDTAMTLGEHLEELRARIVLALIGLFIGLVICLIFGKYIIDFISQPYVRILGQQGQRLLVIGPAEGFVSYMRISLVAGLLLSSPWVFYHLWMFVAAGLYPHERRYVYITIPFSVALFVSGALFFMFIVAPLCLGFLVKFNEVVLEASSTFTFQKYVSFVTTLMLVFGLAFQTPVAIYCLNCTGIITIDALKRSRKFTLMGVVILAAVLTPPDFISQITLAIPLYLLFELGVLFCWLAEKRDKSRRRK